MRPARSALFLVSFALFAAPLAAQSSPIDRAGWLAGCWELRTPTRLTIEMWMPPAGGMMLGASRTTMGERVREFEQLQLLTQGDTLVYRASPSGQATTDFRSVVSASAADLVFENLAHDFPQRIRYRRISADSLVARVEAGARGFDIPMRRVSCQL